MNLEASGQGIQRTTQSPPSPLLACISFISVCVCCNLWPMLILANVCVSGKVEPTINKQSRWRPSGQLK